MNKRLHVLLQQEYIGRRYNGRNKLRGEAATYHLLPKGIKMLKADPERYSPNMLRNLGRDNSARVSEQFIQHNLGLFGIYTSYRQRYGDNLVFVTRSSLSGRDKLPQPLPDAYIALRSDKTKHCFLESFESSAQLFIIKKRIKYYAEFAEDNELPKSRPFPGIVFVCDSEALKKKVEEFAQKRFTASWMKIYFSVHARSDLTETNDLFEFQTE